MEPRKPEASTATLGVAGEGVCDVVEELAHAALVHHFTEDDKKHDIGRRHLDRGAVDAVDVGGQIGHDAVPGVAAVHKDAGHGAPEDRVDQENDRQDAQRGTAQAAGALEHQQDEDRANDDVDRFTLKAGGDEHRIADEHIDRHDGGKREQKPIIPHDLFTARLLKGGIEQEADYQHQSNMDGVVLDVDHLQQADAGSIGQMVERKGKTEEVDELIDPVRLKLAGAGFFFVFLHDLRAFGGVDRSSVAGRNDSGVFLKFSHGRGTPLS